MTGDKNEKDFDTFFLAFSGQQVTITTSINANISVQDNHSQTINNLPLYYEGVLMDYDNEYYYLGDGKEVNQAVRKSLTAHIVVSQPSTIFDDLLNKIPFPNKEEDIN